MGTLALCVPAQSDHIYKNPPLTATGGPPSSDVNRRSQSKEDRVVGLGIARPQPRQGVSGVESMKDKDTEYWRRGHKITSATETMSADVLSSVQSITYSGLICI
jgi:hypothetical protein